MAMLKWTVLAGAIVAMNASTAAAELHISVSLTEKQQRSRGLGSSNDTCRTQYAIKTLGPLLFIETVKSNCRTFQVGKIQGADGSAAAIVFEGRSSQDRKTCSYDAKSRVETCSDRTKVRLPKGPDENYKAQIDTRSKYQLGRDGLIATRQSVRTATTPGGYQERTDATLKMSLSMKGGACQLVEFTTASKTKVLNPGRGRAIKGADTIENRRLVKTESCKVISR
ncbi:hypothetical protein [Vannielia litorea]|uniref:DUF3617 family protein n=1 Tax=Vannielia litorea TaxID=1217970 RepID=A0A1N6HAM2_9RHOB|nr:hypothetical protein [Vannielia litorea]SIO16881.1 hypothetical protein SAMN05444002_3222 [Vannielia litorea]